MKKTVTTVVTDGSGQPLSFKVETVEWNPPPDRYIHNSKSTAALQNLKVGEVKRIVHPELKCGTKAYPATKREGSVESVGRVCSLQPTIYKLRKKGWELDHYHESDHVMVVRRLK